MSEKFYVVSEAELAHLTHAEGPEEFLTALRACRARPVPEWAEEFAGQVSDEGYKDGDHYSIHRRIERIKR